MLLLVLLFARKAKAKFVDWTDREMQAFLDAVKPTGVKPADALLVYALESGLQPEATSGVAWGINQAQGPLLRAAGFRSPPESFARLDAEQQMPFIGKMLAVQARSIGYVPASSAELYRANLSPAAAKSRAEIIYTRAIDGARYTQNRGLDHGNKGAITFDDLAQTLAQVASSALYARHLAKLRRLDGARIQN